MRLLLTIILILGLVVGCADTSKKPTPGHPSWCTKDPKKEPHSHDCEDILPPHLPEECKPPKPLVQKSVEPPKPDPIVGTYKKFPLSHPNFVAVWRIFPDGTATIGYSKHLWENRGGDYQFTNANTGKAVYVVKIQSLAGEPDLVSKRPEGFTVSYSDSESIKLSSDPLYSFDFYSLGVEDEQWSCYNVGRGEKRKGYFLYSGYPKLTAETQDECEALCPALMSHVYNHPDWRKNKSQSEIQQTLARATCPQDRR